MMPRSQDRYANIIMAQVTQSAANAITFKEILTGVSLGSGVGILIDQIDYFIDQTALSLLLATADTLKIGWCVSDSLTQLGFDDRSVIHAMGVNTQFTTSGLAYEYSPKVFQFFPPIIRASARLFLCCASASLASAAVVESRMYFRYVDLSTQEYLELAESGLVIG